MKLKLFLLADYINVADGKLNIIGEFSSIWASEFPVTLPLMCIGMKISLDREDFGVSHEIKVQFVDEHANELWVVNKEFNYPEQHILIYPNFLGVIQLNGMEFEKPTSYQFKLFVEEQLLSSIPLNVVLRESPSQTD